MWSRTYLFSELTDPLHDTLALVCSVFDEQSLCPKLKTGVAVFFDNVKRW